MNDILHYYDIACIIMVHVHNGVPELSLLNIRIWNLKSML